MPPALVARSLVWRILSTSAGDVPKSWDRPGAYYADNHVNHAVGVNGAPAWKQFMIPVQAAFPDRHFTVHFQMVDGDKVLNCWTAHATHTGDFMGIPASGKQVAYNGMSVGRFENGTVVEEWTVLVMFAMTQQLGAIPS